MWPSYGFLSTLICCLHSECVQFISVTVFHTVTLIRQPQLYNQNKDGFIRREVESIADIFVQFWCRTTINLAKNCENTWIFFLFSPLNTSDFPSCHCLVFEIAAALRIRSAPLAGSGAWYTCTEDFGFLKLCESCHSSSSASRSPWSTWEAAYP